MNLFQHFLCISDPSDATTADSLSWLALLTPSAPINAMMQRLTFCLLQLQDTQKDIHFGGSENQKKKRKNLAQKKICQCQFSVIFLHFSQSGSFTFEHF